MTYSRGSGTGIRGITYVKDFGAIADGITDNIVFIQNAIESLDPYQGGKIIFELGTYYISKPIILTRHCHLEGVNGAAIFYQGTKILVAAGQTGIVIQRGDLSGVGHDGGSGSTIKNLWIASQGRNTNTYTGSFNPAQIDTTIPSVTGATTINLYTVTITGPMTYFYVGQWITVGSGYPTGALSQYAIIQAINGQVITMGRPAQATVSGASVIAHERFVTLNSAGDFAIGDLIAIPGAGIQSTVMNERATGAVIDGYATVTVAGCPDGIPIHPGAYITMGAAYPTPTKVLSIDSNTQLTMASNAAATVTAGSLTYITHCRHLICNIIGMHSSNTVLAIDSVYGASAMTSVPIEHAEAGIQCSGAPYIDNCMVGGPGQGFQGPGIAILGHASGYIPSTSCDSWSIKNSWVYACRNAIIAHGADSQAGLAEGVWSIQNREWDFDDASQAGNTWTALQADGGYGFTCGENVNARFISCYQEGGTVSSLGRGANVVGGSLQTENGGNSWIQGAMNRLNIGLSEYHRYTTVFNPDAAAVAFIDNGIGNVSSTLSIRKLGPSDGLGPPGWYAFAHAYGFRSCPLLFADTDEITGIRPATTWLSRGFLLGDNTNEWLDPNDQACRRVESRYGQSTGGIIDNPYTGKTSGWKFGDTIRDAGMLEGYGLRLVTRDGYKAAEWQASHSYNLNDISVATVANDVGFTYVISTAGISGITEPTWGGTTVNDGYAVWTKSNAAAYTQGAASVGGYIKLSVAGSANVTLTSTDIHFLTECIECNGVLTGSINLILPVGRYKRWIFNNTSGAYTLSIKNATGNAVTIAQGSAAFVVSNGTEVRRMTADVVP